MVALDVDGTLTQSGDVISAPVCAAVAQLVAAGIHPVLATGRAVPGALVAAGVLGLQEGWAVCSNGAVIVRLTPGVGEGFEVTDAVVFDPAEALDPIRRAVPDALFAVEDVGRGWRGTAEFPAGELHGRFDVVSYAEVVASPATRVVVRALDLTAQELSAIAGAVTLPCVTYEIGWSAWMDVTAPGVTKASGLEVVRSRLGIEPTGTVAIGDGSNDIPMLRWASRGVAMGGSSPAVLAAATQEAPPAAADGVATIIASILAGARGPAA
jgi:hydroxymethylpyrimidine pyrophosphatase-like HAD family hydrolase